MKAHEDFFLVILHSYIIAAAKEFHVGSNPSTYTCTELAQKLTSKWVKCFLPETYDTLEGDSTAAVAASQDKNFESSGKSYATHLINLGLMWHGFHDSVKEGDGNRILLYWKFLLPIFKQTKHHNYAAEAFELLAQCLVLSPRKVAELK